MNLAEQTSTVNITLDLKTGEFEGAVFLRLCKMFRKLAIVLHQQEEPLTLREIASKLYPKAEPSVLVGNRVHQLIYRFRGWAVANRIPISIENHGGFYRFEVGPGIQVKSVSEIIENPMEVQFESLRKRYRDDAVLRSRDICKALKKSRSHVQRLLRWSVAHGKLEKHGNFSGIHYRFSALNFEETTDMQVSNAADTQVSNTNEKNLQVAGAGSFRALSHLK